LAVFGIVDVALVGGALAVTQSQSHGKPSPIPTFSSNAIPSPTSTPSPDPAADGSGPSTASPVSADLSMPAPRMLSAVSATEAWRATPGSCSGATNSVVEHTVDGGATWTAANTTHYGIRTVVAVDANSARARIVGGSGDSCTTGLFQSFTAGKFWAAYPLNTGTPDYIDPSTGALHLASGVEQAPCVAPLSVAESTAGAAVLCADGALFGRATGASWAKLAVSGVLALASNGADFTIATAGTSTCTGISIGSLATVTPASATVTSVGCAQVTDAAGLTLAQRGSALWLWAGSSAQVSTDAGATWSS
jgi:hypothetical protein